MTTSHGDGKAIVTVRNSGDHVPTAEVARLFEPFQRLASHRAVGSKSIGVGLAILWSIVHTCEGMITAAQNAGGGLAITITLPAEHELPTPSNRAGYRHSDRTSDLHA